jgi:hypothetical protein
LPALGSFPGRTLILSRLSALFIWQILWEPPEPSAPCWRTVATIYPLGNCDSLKPETLLSYLTRLGTVSNRSSPLSSFFAFTDSARTLPEELVNSASVPRLAVGLAGSMCVYAGTSRESAIKVVESVIAEFRNLKASPVPEEELRRSKDNPR